jgi:hypothetical protein
MIINADSLCKTLGNKTSLITLYRTVCMPFNPIHPLTSNGTFARGKRNERPSIIGSEGSKFLVHSMLPLRIRRSLSIRRRIFISAKSSNIGKMQR